MEEAGMARPRIVSAIVAATLEKFYPEDAERHGVEGLVTVAVTLGSEDRATDTQILSESPPEMGFAAAASSLAYSMTCSNPTGAPVDFEFKVKFAHNDPRHTASSPGRTE